MITLFLLLEQRSACENARGDRLQPRQPASRNNSNPEAHTMLRKEQNDLLTQTGPGTPMGELFRRYWLPALLSEELPEPDCPPVRLHLLSERMVAFRKRMKLKGYPMVERGGVIWIYMGPPEHQPPLPEWEFATVPTKQSFMSKRIQECNWLQAMEGGIDSSHVSFLHSGALNHDPLFKGSKGNQYNMGDMKPVFEVVESPGGLYIGARRNAENGNYYWRVTQWVMPAFTMIPPRADHPVHGHFWIPIDDENCWTWTYDFHPVRPLSEREVQALKDGAGVHCKYEPGTYRPIANKDNDYLMDRAAQKAGKTYSGVAGFASQDASLQESMGPICDRTKENLVSTDNGIIMARHRLMRAAKALVDKGTIPPGVDPEHHKVRSASVVLPPDQAFKDAAKEALTSRPGVAHATV